MHRICSNSCIYFDIVLHVNYVKKLVLSIAIDEFLLLQFLLLSVHILLHGIYFIVWNLLDAVPYGHFTTSCSLWWRGFRSSVDLTE